MHTDASIFCISVYLFRDNGFFVCVDRCLRCSIPLLMWACLRQNHLAVSFDSECWATYYCLSTYASFVLHLFCLVQSTKICDVGYECWFRSDCFVCSSSGTLPGTNTFHNWGFRREEGHQISCTLVHGCVSGGLCCKKECFEKNFEPPHSSKIIPKDIVSVKLCFHHSVPILCSSLVACNSGCKDVDLAISCGFVAQTVHMLSSILDLPLRHHILFKGSQSLIRDDVPTKVINNDRE